MSGVKILRCLVCDKAIDTEKEITFRGQNDEKGKGKMIIDKACWDKNSTQYLEKFSIIYKLDVTKENFEFIKIKGKCSQCGISYLVDESELGKKSDKCYKCKDNKSEISSKPTGTEQQSTGETTNNNKSEGISGGIITLIILAVGGILGGLVYYLFWKNKKN